MEKETKKVAKKTTKKSTTGRKSNTSKKSSTAVNKTKAVKKVQTTEKKIKEPVIVEEKEKKVKSVEKPIKSEKKSSVMTDIKKFFDSSIGKLILIVAIIVVVILALFFITDIISKNSNKPSGEDKTVEIQYDEILISNILSQSNRDYYVFVYDDKDSYNDVYNAYMSKYKSSPNATRIYLSALNNGFNKSFKAEESKITSNINELKFSKSTLVKVSNKQIVATYEGSEKIIEHFKSIVK